MDKPKTKEFLSILSNLQAADKKVLFLTNSENDNLFLSFRNLPNVLGYQFHDMNTYDIMNADLLVLTEDSAKAIAEDVKEISAN